MAARRRAACQRHAVTMLRHAACLLFDYGLMACHYACRLPPRAVARGKSRMMRNIRY